MANQPKEQKYAQRLELRHKQLRPLKVVYISNNELGIDNAKAVLTVAITFLVDLLAVIKTKNYLRIAEILFGLIRFGNIIDIAKDAWKEIKDLSQAESQELYNHFAQELDLENDVAEELIERAVSTIPRIYQLALDALDVVAGARDIFSELRVIFGGNGELEELAEKVSYQAAA